LEKINIILNNWEKIWLQIKKELTL
jgi:hypothetical protein